MGQVVLRLPPRSPAPSSPYDAQPATLSRCQGPTLIRVPTKATTPQIMITCYQDVLVLYSSHIAKNRLDFDPFLNPKRRPAS